MNKANTEQNNVAQEVVSQSDDLLKQALSLFDVQPTAPVQMAFPTVIGGDTLINPKEHSIDVTQLFVQQEQLFNGQLMPGVEPSADIEEVSESEELQAVRSMYGAD